MNNRQKRLSLFRRGAAALARVSRHRDVYGCPLCECLFNERAAESGDLSLEDVPPAALGGRPLLLTCCECNRRAGHLIDAEASNRQVIDKFVEAIAGTGSFAGRSKLSLPAVGEINVMMEIDGDDKAFVVPADKNPPCAVERFREAFRAQLQAPSPGDLHVKSVDRYDDRLARISDLKSGYLAAFATFGYSYAMSTHLALVRRQLRNPEAEILTGFWSYLPTADPSPRHLLGVLRQPALALFTRIGSALVVLPIPPGPPDPYSEFSKRYSRGQHIEVQGVPIGWPQGLEMRWDFAS